MDVEAPRGWLRIFDQGQDPRVERAKLHRLTDILAIPLLAVICGADEWTEIELFGRSKLDWLRTFLELPHGIPSHDTFGRVFGRLDPEQLEHCFQQWMQGLARPSGGTLIALDGKTLRRSFDRAGRTKAGALLGLKTATRYIKVCVVGRVVSGFSCEEVYADTYQAHTTNWIVVGSDGRSFAGHVGVRYRVSGFSTIAAEDSR